MALNIPKIQRGAALIALALATTLVASSPSALSSGTDGLDGPSDVSIVSVIPTHGVVCPFDQFGACRDCVAECANFFCEGGIRSCGCTIVNVLALVCDCTSSCIGGSASGGLFEGTIRGTSDGNRT